MSEGVYLWAMRGVVALYGVGGVSGLLVGRWRQGTLCLLFAAANGIMFLGGKW